MLTWRCRTVVSLCALAAAGCASVAGGSRPLWNEYLSGCPIDAGKRGYPVIARASGVSDSALSRVARVVASHLPRRFHGSADDVEPNENERRAIRQLEASVPGSHAIARGDWNPRIGDTASMYLVLRRGRTPNLLAATISSEFQKAAIAAAARAIEYDALPRMDSDSLVIHVRFGTEPAPGDGVARFAMMETEVAPKRGTSRPRYPEGARAMKLEGSVLVAFVVTESGRADRERTVVLNTDAHEFAVEVTSWLSSASFSPQIIDCVAVPVLALQPFHFNLTKPKPAPSTLPP